jgi:hypothetical protein
MASVIPLRRELFAACLAVPHRELAVGFGPRSIDGLAASDAADDEPQRDDLPARVVDYRAAAGGTWLGRSPGPPHGRVFKNKQTVTADVADRLEGPPPQMIIPHRHAINWITIVEGLAAELTHHALRIA